MNESGLILEVSRLINQNYKDIYVIDISLDKVYVFAFDKNNSLVINNNITYTDFIDMMQKRIHKDDASLYFDAISLNKLELESQKGNNETKIKYRLLLPTGEYRYFINIINYLPYEGKKLIFMMSEDINDRLVDIEENSIKLKSKVDEYQNRIKEENESISEALYKINNAFENDLLSGTNLSEAKNYVNSIFNRVSVEHPELNKAIVRKIASSANFRKPSILIVDDSSIIRASLKRIFSEEYNILMAKNGDEAIEIIRQNTGDIINASENIVCVLLDLMMPGSDGFTVLEYFKTNKLFSRIPVAIISGDETRETRKKVYQYDIVDMLEKPFNTENIRRRIGKIIQLYISSNNLKDVVNIQNREMQDKSSESITSGMIIKIVDNIISNNDSILLKKMAKVLATSIQNKYPSYNLDNKYIDGIVNAIPYYNIGSIIIKDDMIVTKKSIEEEIAASLDIINIIIDDQDELKICENICKNCFEMFNGSGYPNNLKGNEIPIEAQITNILVRIITGVKKKSFNTVIKNIVVSDEVKYNKDILDCLKEVKRELKEILK